MNNLVGLECFEYIDDAKPFVLMVFYGAFRNDVTELNVPARKMYDTLVKMGELNMEFESDGIIQQKPLPFTALEQYINEMDFNMQQRVLNSYLLYTEQQKYLS